MQAQREKCWVLSHYDLSSNEMELPWLYAINTCSVFIRKGGTVQQKRKASNGNKVQSLYPPPSETKVPGGETWWPYIGTEPFKKSFEMEEMKNNMKGTVKEREK